MTRPIDHVVIAGRNLEALAQSWRRLGFLVGARNHHPFGTRNHVVQFAGGFVELIGLEGAWRAPIDPSPRIYSFAGFINEFLGRREGAAMLALASADARADAQAFREAEIGDFEPFHFERRGERADGSRAQIAFTLAFARARSMEGVGFFACQHHQPEDFQDAALQVHANGARGIAGVTLVAENPADHAQFLSLLTSVRDFHASSMGLSFQLARDGAGQTIEVLTPIGFAFRYGGEALVDASGEPRIAAITLATDSLASVAEALAGASAPHALRQGRVIVPPDAAGGVALVFALEPAG